MVWYHGCCLERSYGPESEACHCVSGGMRVGICLECSLQGCSWSCLALCWRYGVYSGGCLVCLHVCTCTHSCSRVCVCVCARARAMLLSADAAAAEEPGSRGRNRAGASGWGSGHLGVLHRSHHHDHPQTLSPHEKATVTSSSVTPKSTFKCKSAGSQPQKHG